MRQYIILALSVCALAICAPKGSCQQTADSLADPQPALSAVSLGQTGATALRAGRYGDARDAFAESASVAETGNDWVTAARSQFNLGHAHASLARLRPSKLDLSQPGARGVTISAGPTPTPTVPRALVAYRSAAELAARATDPELEAKAWTEAIRAGRLSGETAFILRDVEAASQRILALAPSIDPVTLAGFYNETLHAAAEAGTSFENAVALDRLITGVVDRLEEADRDGDLAFALGLQARGRALDGAGDEARRLTRRALRVADAAGDERQLYLWHAQIGKLAARDGDWYQAERAYNRAFESLQLARARYGFGDRLDERYFFNDEVRPVFDIYLGHLLDGSGPVAEGNLQRALTLMNLLRRLELEQYMADACVAEQSVKAIGKADPEAAIIFPIVRRERIDTISLIDGRLVHRFSILGASEADAVSTAASRLRRDLGFSGTTDYREPARLLYDHLIAPLEADLKAANVERLVFSMDGQLRLIPPAVLWDGERHLVERYGIALAPDLSLRGVQPFRQAGKRAVYFGLSEAVDGFDPLAAVPAEIAAVSSVLPGTTRLDGAFTSEAAASLVTESDPTVLHIATHGEFGGTNETSYLLTHDGPLSMDGFGRMVSRSSRGGDSLELIVLSACKTAEGDERAILGLAGLAIRSGAKAAMGSLWSVSDTSTRDLQAAFYSELMGDAETKADALRAAQVAVMAQPGTAHPYHWGAFVLVGNWL